MVYHEARLIVSSYDTRSEIVESPASCGSSADGPDHIFKAEACLCSVDKRLADTYHGSGDHDLVAHLCLLSA